MKKCKCGAEMRRMSEEECYEWHGDGCGSTIDYDFPNCMGCDMVLWICDECGETEL